MTRQTEYWRARKQHDGTFVEYGNDVEGSAFSARNSRDPLGSSRWNLQARPAGALVKIWQKPPCAGAMLCRTTITARGSPHWCRPAAALLEADTALLSALRSQQASSHPKRTFE